MRYLKQTGQVPSDVNFDSLARWQVFQQHTVSGGLELGKGATAGKKDNGSELSHKLLPFVAHSFVRACRDRLPWNNDQVMIWLGTHTLPLLLEWKDQCYDDVTLRGKLVAFLQSNDRQSIVNAITKLCSASDDGREVLQTPLFGGEHGDPQQHIAHTASKVHHASFKNTVWAAAFSQNEDGGYMISIKLVLDIFADLYERGNFSYFRALLGGKPEVGVEVHGTILQDGGKGRSDAAKNGMHVKGKVVESNKKTQPPQDKAARKWTGQKSSQ